MKDKIKILTVFALFFAATQAFSWGGRGHAAICEAAVFLVKNPQLKEYLQNKPHMMGHLCNVPDIYWKTLSPEFRKAGDPGHFINAENLGLKISEIPTDYKTIVATYTGQENKSKDNKKIFSVPDELGSNWWRAEQFYKRAIADGQALKAMTTPTGFKDEQNEELPFNKTFYSMIVNLGLMGHFIGDASQPFHSTSDYDGYAANHGGIHAYYEDSCVAYFDADLVARIVKKAKSLKNPKWTSQKTYIENMKAFSEVALEDLKTVLKLDPVTTPSVIKIEKGMSLKTPAERKPASVGFQKFEKIILEEMARSSYLLAHYWDEAYKSAGEPQMKAYKSYRYPLTPEFVMPDYYDTSAKATEKK
jgi:hypothetical protein